jgi:hypothetical protein
MITRTQNRSDRERAIQRFRMVAGSAPWRIVIQYPFRLACGHIYMTEHEGAALEGGVAWCLHCQGVKQIVATGSRVGMRWA